MAKLSSTFDPGDFGDDAPSPFTGLPDLPAIVELRSHRQWVAWRYEDRGGPKPTKVPISPRSGAKAMVNVASSWGTCEEAERRVARPDSGLAGVGFVLTAGDEFVGIDLDDVVDEQGVMAPWAAEIVGWAETYTELSPSRRGLRMIARGTIEKAVKQGDAGVELYAVGRYVTITGDHLTGTPEDIRAADRTIAAVIARAEAAKETAGLRKEIGKKERSSAENQRPECRMGITDNPRLRAYVDEAFRDEIAGVETAGKGTRNNQLNQAAFSLFQMVAAGWLSATEVVAALVDAAARCGLIADDGMHAVQRTISSGRIAGMRQPREVPPEIAEDHENAEAGARLVAGLRRGERVDPETGEITDIGIPITEQRQELAKQSSSRRLPILDPTTLQDVPVPSRRWWAEDLIPAGTVTELSGDGGAGKSLLALQACVAAATGGVWLGMRIDRCRALFLTAEDEADEVHRRLADILLAERIRFDELGLLRIAPMAGEDAVLAAASAKTGVLSPTSLWTALKAYVEEWAPTFLVLDTRADLFGGNEVDRVQVRQFVSMLRNLALAHGMTIVMLAHPSVAGMNTGSGLSGSTAWNNSVRSRLYMRRAIGNDGSEVDPDVRVLTNKKANYGRAGGEIQMRWDAGRFVRTDDGVGPIDAATARARADALFLDMLATYDRQGRTVNATSGPNYAPAVFAADPAAEGTTREAFRDAMNRLFAAGAIRNVEFGPASTRRMRLAVVSEWDVADHE